ncbi:MAG: gamma carbonic anhydrase family protein [Myxococcales bacterium]|nr:gamma carbonic anhydrase family protein [Myxococcales bacterium]
MSVVIPFAAHVPTIDPDAYLAEQSVVIGDVTIGAGSSIWFGTVIRGDMMPIRIGRDTSIQDNSVVHITGDVSGTTIGDRVTVGHRAIIHACTVEDDCLIGMGAIILDRARIGRGSVVGAGALITPGTEIPPGSFVLGAPAKVKRAVDDRERGWIASSAAHYVELARTYRDAQLARARAAGDRAKQ